MGSSTLDDSAGQPERVHGLKLPLGATTDRLGPLVASALGVSPAELAEVRVVKVSLDARGAVPLQVYTVDAWRIGQDVPPARVPALRVPAGMRALKAGQAPIIVGTGPAGLWAAIRLVRAGIPSILLDRGGALSDRHGSVRKLRRGRELDPESNLCFGAGGAGTYSDGKLYTRKRSGLVQAVYEDLVALGASEDILTAAHPHVGTNRLIKMLGGLEQFLVEAGCELRYGQKVEGLLRDTGGRVAGVRLASGVELKSPATILATGHSARDVYRWLHETGVILERKPFAIGMRCEHPQTLIDAIQYGRHAARPELEPSEYFLKTQVSGRGVYSFCMCPGGFVIPTPTEVGHLNVNGMSNAKRGGRFANAALVVEVRPDDFYIESPGDRDHLGPLAGLELQRHLERLAFEHGGSDYSAPAQRLTDFLKNRAGDLPERTSFRPGTQAANLRGLLPRRFAEPLARAVHGFDRKMGGYLTKEAQLFGFETTTSSPIRIPRNEQLQAPGFDGLFPCGEGAGYAGGIVSSAIDGIRCAEAAMAVLGR